MPAVDSDTVAFAGSAICTVTSSVLVPETLAATTGSLPSPFQTKCGMKLFSLSSTLLKSDVAKAIEQTDSDGLLALNVPVKG
ncbi:unknown [Eggerthella sp. CAG:368]|nr:unknown [Eggerthella sp. CAG:368]